MVFSINLDRGVHMRTHPSLSMDIYMYVDDPGVYYTAHGDKIDPELARAAGFPVDKQLHDHKVNEALKQAQKEVLEKFGEAKSAVLKERDGFKIMDLGMGRHNVLGPEGDLLNKMPLSLEQAEILLKHLAPEPVAKSNKK